MVKRPSPERARDDEDAPTPDLRGTTIGRLKFDPKRTLA
jgi:hypothetical protein